MTTTAGAAPTMRSTLDLPEIVRECARLAQARPLLLVGGALLVSLLASAGLALTERLAYAHAPFRTVADVRTHAYTSSFTLIAGFVVVTALKTALLGALTLFATVYDASHVSDGAIVRETLRRLPAALAVTVVFMTLTAIGASFLVVPAFFVATKLSLVPSLYVHRRLGLMDALAQSDVLTQGHGLLIGGLFSGFFLLRAAGVAAVFLLLEMEVEPAPIVLQAAQVVFDAFTNLALCLVIARVYVALALPRAPTPLERDLATFA